MTLCSVHQLIWIRLSYPDSHCGRRDLISVNEYYFSLNISRDEYLRYYQGQAVSVAVTDSQGRNIRFPANALRPHVLHTGIQGRFRLITDDSNRLQRLERIV